MSPPTPPAPDDQAPAPTGSPAAKPRSAVEQLRGASRLAVAATLSVTDIVERMHHEIGGGPALLGRPFVPVVKLLSAPTYWAIRGVTRGVGASLDLALGALSPAVAAAGAEGGAVLAALNGVIGDYLAETDNPLAIETRLCLAGEGGGAPLDLSPEALKASFPEGDRLLVLVHGSAADNSGWLRKGHDHGAALARDLGLVPLALRYNSGLHVSQNGRRFAALLEALVAAWPRPVRELVFLAHSMGGLVCRSAARIGELEGQAWRPLLRAMVTLGTPHHGAPLERGGNWIEPLLEISRYSAPLSRLGRLRSAGVTDLRYGNVLDEDWAEIDRFARGGDPRKPLPLPQDVACYAIAASLAKAGSKNPSGDGLVPVDSALGRHKRPELKLGFGDDHQWIACGCSHLDLLSSAEVYGKIREFLS